MRIPDDKFNLPIQEGDQAHASQLGEVISTNTEPAPTSPNSADTVETFSGPINPDLPQLDEPNFPSPQPSGTADVVNVPDPVVSGREETTQVQEGNPLNPYLSLFESPTLNAQIPGQSAPLAETGLPDKLISANPRKDLPVDSPGTAFNLPGLDAKIAPDHFGIDLSVGGIHSNDVIADTLGIGKESQGTSTSQSGTADSSGLQARPGTSLYADGEGTETVADGGKKKSTADEIKEVIVDTAYKVADKVVEAVEYVELLWKPATAPVTVKEVTGDAADLLRGVKAFGTGDSGDALLKKVDDGNKYVNPDADPTVTGDLGNLTPEELARAVNLRHNVNVMPSNTDDPQPISLNPNRVHDPMAKPLVTDGNPDFYESEILSTPDLDVRNNATGGDTVNPNEDAAPPAPPTKPPE